MRKQICDLILRILKDRELEVMQVTHELENQNASLSWETVQRYLKRMTNEGRLTRKSGERPDGDFVWRRYYGKEKKPWVYYYKTVGEET